MLQENITSTKQGFWTLANVVFPHSLFSFIAPTKMRCGDNSVTLHSG